MKVWDRNTPWRQGSVLKNVEGLLDFGEFHFAMVISHDCDLSADLNKEPLVEFLLGNIGDLDSSKEYGRNPRELHIQIHHERELKTANLFAAYKRLVKKEDLINFQPDENFILESEQKELVQKWLSDRYTRAALPDGFGSRFNELMKEVEKHFKSTPLSSVLGIFFSYDPIEELDPGEPYEVKIYVVYEDKHLKSREEAEQAKSKIEESYRKLKSSRGTNYLQMENCQVFEESEFSLANLRRTKKWQKEYISLSKDPGWQGVF